MTIKHLYELVRRVCPPDEDIEDPDDLAQLVILVQRQKEQIRRRARYHWSLLRNCISNTIEAISSSDFKDIVVVHGIHHEREVTHKNIIEQVIFIEATKQYLTSDGRHFRLFAEDGQKKAVITTEEPMDRAVFSSRTNQFICWLDRKEFLYLLTTDFEIISQAKAPDAIYLATMNRNNGELITLGPNFFQCWVVRYGARYLIPRLTVNTEFGVDEMFTMLALEDTASRKQRIFYGYDRGVVVFNVHEGKMLEHKKDLHVRAITAIMFFNPLKQLISGSVDGTIKVWDMSWHVKMVFVGHSKTVHALNVYPQGPSIMSASEDGTIRVWNMETCDVVDSVTIPHPVVGLGSMIKLDNFYTYYGRKMNLWKMKHLYHIHTAIGYRVNTIKMTAHPLMPLRAVVMCRDSSIRIVSPPAGDVITTLLLNPADTGGLVDAAYAVVENVLFTVLGNGNIIKSDTNTNPCTVIATWKPNDPGEVCNCLLVYEYVVDSLSEHDIWSATKRGVATKSIVQMGRSLPLHPQNRTLLLGGRKDGYISVFNWDTGEVDFKVEAHGSRGVLSMIANSCCDQLISAGMDNVIKVWRLYPFASEALAPLMSFYCAHTPVYMSTCKSILSVAFQDLATATFSTVVYHLRSKTFGGTDSQNLDAFSRRYDHEPQDDHTDSLTGMTSCPRMKLFATSSLDGTIRIWNETNKLVRVLKLNTTPYSIGFCSQKGDLLLGAGDHLFIIPYTKYMPKAFTFKMMSMTFAREKPEKPLPYDEEIMNRLSKDDVKRLKNSRSSFKFDSYTDILSEDEEMELKKEQIIRDHAFGIIDAREEDIRLIKDGVIKPARKPVRSKKTKTEAFLNYMKLFYDKPKIELPPEEDEEDIEEVISRILHPKEEEKKEEPYKPGQAEMGFFPPIPAHRPPPPETSSAMEPLQPGYPISYSGFIPNSILLKLMWPAKSLDDQKKQKKYQPPTLTASQLDQIREDDHTASKLRRSVTFATQDTTDISQRVMAFNWDDDEKEEADVQDDEDVDVLGEGGVWSGHKKRPVSPLSKSDSGTSGSQTPVSRKASSLVSKFEEIMQRTPTPQPSTAAAAAAEAVPLTTDSSRTSLDTSSSRTGLKPLKPVEKLTPRPKPRPRRRASSSASGSIPTVRTPTPSPFPDYILQFKDSHWFKDLMNDLTEEAKQDSRIFVAWLINKLETVPMNAKQAIIEALMKLFEQGLFSPAYKFELCTALIKVLNTGQVPTCTVPVEKELIMTALKSLYTLVPVSKDLICQLMINFLDGDRDIRKLALDILEKCGLVDPHKKLQKELDSWDIWNIDAKNRKTELQKMVEQWLGRWKDSYMMHMKDTIEQIKKGKNVHGRVPRDQLMKKRKEMFEAVREGVEPATVIPGPSLTVTLDGVPDSSVADNVTSIDIINYFCEMMMEKDLEMLKRRKTESKEKAMMDESKYPKNTVLVLPKPPHKNTLVRLGDTHTSCCRAERETNLSTDYSVPGVNPLVQHQHGELFKITRFINLPMKTQYMNPFPSAIDKHDRRFQDSVLITLRSSQKFFIPARSLVTCPPCS